MPVVVYAVIRFLMGSVPMECYATGFDNIYKLFRHVIGGLLSLISSILTYRGFSAAFPLAHHHVF